MAEETGDIERMVFLLEARTNELEKGMKKADAIAKKAYGAMKRDSASATDKMEHDMIRSTNSINRALSATSTKIGGFGKSMVAGFAGGLVAGGLAGVIARLGQVASGVAAVGDEAKRAGLGVEAFQELSYVAQQNRVGIDALTDGIKELNLRADEFIVSGGGSAAEAFQRLGYSAEELNRQLQDPSALFTEIIGKLGDLDRAAQIRIADELFGGTGGEQFVQLIGQGEEGIQRTIEEAHRLGLVMDAGVIARAAEVDRKFHQIATTVGTTVQGALVDLLYPMLDFLKAQDEAIRRNRLLAMSADATKEHDATVASIEGILSALDRVAPESAAHIRRIATAAVEGGMSANEARDELIKMATDPDMAPIIGDLNGLIGVLELLVGRTRTARQELASITSDPIGAGPTWEGVQSLVAPPKPTTVPGSAPAGGGRSSEANEIDRQKKAVEALIVGLEFERSLIGLSALDQQKLTTLRQAGAAATEEQRLKIGELVEATYAEQMRAEQMQSTFDLLGQAGQNAFEGILEAAEDGKVTLEEFGSVLSNVLKMAGSSFLNQAFGGIGAALGGGLKLPGFATGTANTGGRRGEARGIVHGQEAVIPLPSGGKVPVQLAGSAGLGPTVQIIDQRTNAPPIERQEGIGANGERQVRLIVRDEWAQMQGTDEFEMAIAGAMSGARSARFRGTF